MRQAPRLIFTIAIFISQTCIGQVTASAIDFNWTNLKTQLQSKSDIIIKLSGVLSQSQIVDKTQLDISRASAADLTKHLDTLTNKNNASISLTYSKNKKLTQAISRVLVMLENDPALRARKEVMTMFAQLLDTENKIALAIKQYNDTCKKQGRPDLVFGKDT